MANAEIKVITAVCKNKDMSVLLSDGVGDMFSAYEDVWDTLKDYYIQYRSVPDIKILEEKFGDLDVTEVSGDTEYYLNELRDEYISGRMEQIIRKIAKARDDGEPPAKILEKATSSLSKLNKYSGNVKDVDMTDYELAARHYDAVRERSAIMGGSPGIPSGFKSIDSAYTTGFAPGHLVYSMGFSAKGKTWFTAKLAVNAWKQGFKPMIVSLEMTPESMRDRIYTLIGSGHFDLNDLGRGDIQEDDFKAWGKKVLEESPPFIVISNDGMNDVTPSVVGGWIEKHRPDIVFFDYAQLGLDNAKTENMIQRMMNQSREFKNLAVNNGIPIVVISSVTDDQNHNRDDPPGLSQLAWSRAMEYNADMVFAVHRATDSDLIEVVGRKNRFGELFDFYFEVDLAKGIWEEKFSL